MKKTLKLVSVMLVLVALCSIFAACSKVSQGYADKINKAAEDGEAYTYTQVIEDLGDEAIDVTTDLPIVGRNGIIYAAKGCKTWDEIQAKIDAGEKVEGLTIVIAGGKATDASYGVINEKK
ncbi:MAG: hypothetical protein IJF75_01650 [Clostridia bacterium]|nr:hypothetical protein [Clostridia bacterium]